jgi:hypothetical protein
MIKRSTILAFCVFVFAAAAFGQGTDASIKPTYVRGDVVSVDAGKIVVKTDTGQFAGSLSATTQYKRVPPENPDLKAAVAATLSDIGVADKVLLSALAAKEGGFAVRSVYLMTKADLSQKTAKDTEAWRTRGISGKVTSVKPETNQIVVETGGMMNKTSITLTPKTDAKFLRYAPDSVRFADAKLSSLTDVKPGDEIRALGDKSTDGTTFTAETVLSGGFRQTAGTIKSIDAANKEVVIKDIAGKDLTVSFANAVMMKRFPPEMADRMAAMQGGGGGVMPAGVQVIRPAGQPGAIQPPAGANAAAPGANGPRPMGGGRGAGLGDMIDKLPSMTVEELKVGDMIGILTSGPVTATQKVSAIKLIAGVEPFLKMAQMAQGASGGRTPGSPNFNIPGLDGVSFP